MVETRAPPTGRGEPERTGMSKEINMNKKRLQSLTPGALYAGWNLGSSVSVTESSNHIMG